MSTGAQSASDATHGEHCACGNCGQILPICRAIDVAITAYVENHRDTETTWVLEALVRVLARSVTSCAAPTKGGLVGLRYVALLAQTIHVYELQSQKEFQKALLGALTLATMPDVPPGKAN